MKHRKRKSSHEPFAECHEASRKRRTLLSSHGFFDNIPIDIFAQIFSSLSVQDLFRLRAVNKRFQYMVDLYLSHTTSVSFCNGGNQWDFAKGNVHDKNVIRIFSFFPKVEQIDGLYFENINFRRVTRSQSRAGYLSYRGLLVAFKSLQHLKRISTNDIALASWMMSTFPSVFVDLRFSGRVKLLTTPINIPKDVASNKFWLVNQTLPPFPLRGEHIENVVFENVSLKGRRSTVEYFSIECPKLREMALRRNCFDTISSTFTSRILYSLARCQYLEVLELANVDCTPNDLELAILEETREGHEPFRHLKKLILSECEIFSMGDIARLIFACQDSLTEFRMDPTFCTSALLRVLNASGVKFEKMDSLHIGYCGHDSLPWDMPYDAFCRIDDDDIGRLNQMCPNLRELSLRGCPFLQDARRWKGKWERLKNLQVAYCGSLGLDTVIEFANKECTNLDHISLHCITVTGKTEMSASVNHAIADKNAVPLLSSPRNALCSPPLANSQGSGSKNTSAGNSSMKSDEVSRIDLEGKYLNSVSIVKCAFTHLSVNNALASRKEPLLVRVGHCPEFRSIEVPSRESPPLEMTLVECPEFSEGIASLPGGSIVLTTPSPKLEDFQWPEKYIVDASSSADLWTTLDNIRRKVRDPSWIRTRGEHQKSVAVVVASAKDII
ncbi:uncharacterized protein LOC100905537 [Galendromus occidentalis]|uniref:Uncharacterized protein LOC100905537 n=1 Tax=Galendromus occidentalis TaxID=34638 RepID=A0AAJ6QUL3_9ACAR|nr:uncharacterized protein LOC100905537 [Galendromus occidentalis]